MKHFLTLLVTLTTLFFNTAAQQLNLTKGQLIETTLQSDQTMDLGSGMEMKSDVSSAYTLTVADIISDSLYQVFASFASIKATAVGMGQNQEYDSETGEGKDTELGKAFHDKIGRIDTVILNKLTARLVVENDGMAANPITALQNQTLELGSVIENLFFILPPGKNAKDKWLVKSDLNGIDSDTEYELLSLSENIAAVNFKTGVNGTSKMEMEGMTVNVTTNGTISGTLKVDVTTGVIQQKVLDSDLKSSMELMGQTMEMSVKGKTTVTNTLRR